MSLVLLFTRIVSIRTFTSPTISTSWRGVFSKKSGAFMHIPDNNDPELQTNLDEMKNVENYWLKQIEEKKKKQTTSSFTLSEAKLRVDEIYEDLQGIEKRADNDLKKDVQKIEKKVKYLGEHLLLPKQTT